MERYWPKSRIDNKAHVWLALDQETGAEVVMKLADINRDSSYGERNDRVKLEAQIQRELSPLNLKRIVNFKAFYTNNENQYVLIVEKGLGNLAGVLEMKSILSELETKLTVCGILEVYNQDFDSHFKPSIGLSTCHKKLVVHRNLKPGNLFLFDNNLNSLKIGDFGISVEDNGYSSIGGISGTRGYMAPEVLSGQRYGRPVDMWAVGVMAYQMLFGSLPFPVEATSKPKLFGLGKKLTAKNLVFPTHPHEISSIGKQFIQELLVDDPDGRITCEQALQHSWIQSLDERVKFEGVKYMPDPEIIAEPVVGFPGWLKLIQGNSPPYYFYEPGNITQWNHPAEDPLPVYANNKSRTHRTAEKSASGLKKALLKTPNRVRNVTFGELVEIIPDTEHESFQEYSSNSEMHQDVPNSEKLIIPMEISPTQEESIQEALSYILKLPETNLDCKTVSLPQLIPPQNSNLPDLNSSNTTIPPTIMLKPPPSPMRKIIPLQPTHKLNSSTSPQSMHNASISQSIQESYSPVSIFLKNEAPLPPVQINNTQYQTGSILPSFPESTSHENRPQLRRQPTRSSQQPSGLMKSSTVQTARQIRTSSAITKLETNRPLPSKPQVPPRPVQVDSVAQKSSYSHTPTLGLKAVATSTINSSKFVSKVVNKSTAASSSQNPMIVLKSVPDIVEKATTTARAIRQAPTSKSRFINSESINSKSSQLIPPVVPTKPTAIAARPSVPPKPTVIRITKPLVGSGSQPFVPTVSSSNTARPNNDATVSLLDSSPLTRTLSTTVEIGFVQKQVAIQKRQVITPTKQTVKKAVWLK
ncbi:hypothetical protein HK100_006044 [Physocladia obscura]|uniref:Protein kinase domain-containing protein n=1 Tax=Physocladia obscura TaxID=109957 RepID=A0AAD5SSZ4_9FUNG|nr:hypothetical protein HK100_006044 [Physocladia obscura]